ncbi:hypothetical protein BDV06DRAFT_185287 [Aspergillus oleicola]
MALVWPGSVQQLLPSLSISTNLLKTAISSPLAFNLDGVELQQLGMSLTMLFGSVLAAAGIRMQVQRVEVVLRGKVDLRSV